MEIRGHSWETNLPARRLVYTRDLYLPVQELAARIAATARNVLESTPPELAADVAKNGILLTGGGSMLRGLAGYIAGERMWMLPSHQTPSTVWHAEPQPA